MQRNPEHNKIKKLELAISKGNLELVKTILQEIPLKELKVEKGKSTLHKAAEYCRGEEGKKIIALLISKSVNPNLRAGAEGTPLHHAVEMNNLDAIKALAAAEKTDLNIKTTVSNDGQTALEKAAVEGKSAAVLALLRAGAKFVDWEIKQKLSGGKIKQSWFTKIPKLDKLKKEIKDLILADPNITLADLGRHTSLYDFLNMQQRKSKKETTATIDDLIIALSKRLADQRDEQALEKDWAIPSVRPPNPEPEPSVPPPDPEPEPSAPPPDTEPEPSAPPFDYDYLKTELGQIEKQWKHNALEFCVPPPITPDEQSIEDFRSERINEMITLHNKWDELWEEIGVHMQGTQQEDPQIKALIEKGEIPKLQVNARELYQRHKWKKAVTKTTVKDPSKQGLFQRPKKDTQEATRNTMQKPRKKH